MLQCQLLQRQAPQNSQKPSSLSEDTRSTFRLGDTLEVFGSRLDSYNVVVVRYNSLCYLCLLVPRDRKAVPAVSYVLLNSVFRRALAAKFQMTGFTRQIGNPKNDHLGFPDTCMQTLSHVDKS